MQSEKTNIRSTLNAILPTYYAEYIKDDKALPCITYTETGNGESIYVKGFRRGVINYEIDVNTKSVADMETYSAQVDTAMRDLGYHRVTGTELVVDNLHIKTLVYEGEYNEY